MGCPDEPRLNVAPLGRSHHAPKSRTKLTLAAPRPGGTGAAPDNARRQTPVLTRANGRKRSARSAGYPRPDVPPNRLLGSLPDRPSRRMDQQVRSGQLRPASYTIGAARPVGSAGNHDDPCGIVEAIVPVESVAISARRSTTSTAATSPRAPSRPCPWTSSGPVSITRRPTT
jgi:hypothetical protein